MSRTLFILILIFLLSSCDVYPVETQCQEEYNLLQEVCISYELSDDCVNTLYNDGDGINSLTFLVNGHQTTISSEAMT